MRTQPETRARSAQEAGKRALNLGASKTNQACTRRVSYDSRLNGGSRAFPPFATVLGTETQLGHHGRVGDTQGETHFRQYRHASQ